MFGNFIADHIKGKAIENYHGDIYFGIQLHRFIDHYTDHHQIIKQSKQRLTKVIGKYAPVVVDVYLDHFLANHWNKYHVIDLPSFVENQYKILQSKFDIMPEKTQLMFPYLVKYNWLLAYKSFDGLQSVFNGMNKRAKFVSNMNVAVEALKTDYSLYEEEFHQFFPMLIAETNLFINSQK